jgi:hypothetical protein
MYGLSYLGREEIRLVMRHATATRSAGASDIDYSAWRRDLKLLSGD